MTISQATVDERFSAEVSASDTRSVSAPSDFAQPVADAAEEAAVAPAPGDKEIARILGLTVPVSVTLAQRPMRIESIIGITVGTILEFDIPSDAELSLQVANRTIGRGQAVKIGENFGLRVGTMTDIEQRIGALGG